MSILAQGAEALIIKSGKTIIKRRIKKNYRLEVLDERLRKSRTKSEAKIIDKLSKRINVPEIIKVDERTKEIIMEFIDGIKISESLDSFSLAKQKKICGQIGKELGKIHDENLIHGDLTTSNMILKENRVYFIDFGLGFHSSRIEDKAVDLHLFKQALESKHFKNAEILFKEFLKGYSSKEKSRVLEQFKKVESRGRYKHE